MDVHNDVTQIWTIFDQPPPPLGPGPYAMLSGPGPDALLSGNALPHSPSLPYFISDVSLNVQLPFSKIQGIFKKFKKLKIFKHLMIL